MSQNILRRFGAVAVKFQFFLLNLIYSSSIHVLVQSSRPVRRRISRRFTRFQTMCNAL